MLDFKKKHIIQVSAVQSTSNGQQEKSYTLPLEGALHMSME